ncbi:hypothetical protein ILUMI_08676 [Ignelater luminosus]|uniref:Fatty acyl-CoA reductase n=1 Tax=Ignelater luminosus TaxID=2038154 RepID=A0A8K0D179_IGNLU|nr:hypothetical protein ILUMI_08676 [Ignelater luminosus]
MKNCPNTYTYSKALAEGIVSEEMNNLPICIMRPSIVVPIWKDPLPGWTDNLYGPTGLLIAAGKGILRSMFCDPQGFADFVPADIVANAFICVAWYFLQNRDVQIYNLTSTAEIRVTWGEIIDMGKKIAAKDMPFNWVVWYPGGSIKTSRLLHEICAIFLHYIPAIFLDSLIVLTGNKPVLWKVHQKIRGGSELLEYYVHRKWEFSSDNGQATRKVFNENEKKIYPLDKTGLDIYNYFYNATHGARLYLLKESDETLPTARRHMNVMWAVDRICKVLLLFGLLYFLFTYVFKPALEIQ